MVTSPTGGPFVGSLGYLTFNYARDSRRWRNGSSAAQVRLGGNGRNGPAALRSLGYKETLVIALAGEDYQEFDGPGVQLTIVWGSRIRTIHYLVDDDGSEQIDHVTDGLKPEPWHVNEVVSRLKSSVRPGQIVVITGSLPDGVEPKVLAEVIKWLRANHVFVILDARPELLAAIEPYHDCHPHALKANWEEWQGLVGGDPKAVPDCQKLLRQAARLFPDTMVIVSLGKLGVFVRAGDKAYHLSCNPKGLKVATRIGCGDTFAAVFAKALLDGLDLIDCLRHAIAAATANLVTPEPGHFNIEDFLAFLALVVWQEITADESADELDPAQAVSAA